MIYSLNLRLPTRFLILDKALATLAAVGVELTPDFNVFEIANLTPATWSASASAPSGCCGAPAATGRVGARRA